jgi:hypothetical protein
MIWVLILDKKCCILDIKFIKIQYANEQAPGLPDQGQALEK